MPIKTIPTKFTVTDFINNCSSIEDLQLIMDKCRDKINAMQRAKLISAVEQIGRLAEEIARNYPWEDTPFYDENNERIPWSDVEDTLLNYLENNN